MELNSPKLVDIVDEAGGTAAWCYPEEGVGRERVSEAGVVVRVCAGGMHTVCLTATGQVRTPSGS